MLEESSETTIKERIQGGQFKFLKPFNTVYSIMEINMDVMKWLLIAAMFFPSVSFACAFDVDCSPGSKCLKGSGQLYGYCAGGISPGNSNDSNPAYNPLDLSGSAGDTCSFNTDCGVGGRCLKEAGYVDGVCITR